MKNLLTISALIALPLIFFACNKKQVENQLTRDWTVTGVTTYITITTDTSTTEEIEYNFDDTEVTFLEDGTGTSSGGTASSPSPFPDSFTWEALGGAEADGQKINVTPTGTPITREYLLLDRSTQKMKMERTYTTTASNVTNDYRISILMEAK